MRTNPSKQKNKKRKGPYLLRVSVTEKDLDALEDLAVACLTEKEEKKYRKVLLKLWQQMVKQIG